MIVTVSQIEELIECGVKEFFHYIMGRVPEREYRAALDRGTWFHKEMENWLKGKEVRFETAELGDVKPEDLRKAELVAGRGRWYMQQPAPWDEVLKVEETFEMDLGDGVTLLCKPDAYVVKWEKVWDTSWKTYSGDYEDVRTRVINSLHSVTYGLGVPQLFPGMEYGGTMLGAFSTESDHVQQAGAVCEDCGKKGYTWKHPSMCVKVEYLAMSKDALMVGREKILWAVEKIGEQKSFAQGWDPTLPPYIPPSHVALQNFKACLAYHRMCGYRKGPCEYLGSVMNQIAYRTEDPYAHHEVKA